MYVGYHEMKLAASWLALARPAAGTACWCVRCSVLVDGQVSCAVCMLSNVGGLGYHVDCQSLQDVMIIVRMSGVSQWPVWRLVSDCVINVRATAMLGLSLSAPLLK